jgi:hypothetical protein
MTPKQKADSLIYKIFNNTPISMYIEEVKNLAIILCDEVIENLEDHTGEDIKYWNEVKNEINKS